MRCRVLAFITLAIGVACAPLYEERIEVVEVLGLDATTCVAGAPRASGVLDLGLIEPSPYIMVLRFEGEALLDGEPVDARTFPSTTRSFFTSNDVELVLATTPRAPESSPRAGISGTSETPPNTDVVFAMLISVEESASLITEPAIARALSSPEARVRIDAHVAIEGTLVRAESTEARVQLFDNDRVPAGPPSAVDAPFFTFPLELCLGCLLPRCAPGEVHATSCLPGQDTPSQCIPE